MSDSIETSEDMAQPWVPALGGDDPTEDPITHAARLLRESAVECAEGVSIDGVPDWGREPDAKAYHDELMAAASALEAPRVTPLVQAERRVLALLLDLARAAFVALDDSEDMEGDDGERCHCVDAQAFDELQEALDGLDDLPDDRPGYALGPAGKAEWALRRLLGGQQITLSPAALAVLRERQRQLDVEGWTPAHDDEHFDESLAMAAAWYATPHYTRQALDVNDMGLWPTSWDPAAWRPSPGNRWRDLEKAGALIQAEMERLHRAGQAPLTPSPTTTPKGTS